MAAIRYYRTAERPDIELWLYASDGVTLPDLSSHTVEFKIGVPGETAIFTKAATGQAGSGTEPNGTPNVVVTIVAGDLDDVEPGQWAYQVRATSGGLDQYWQEDFELRDIIG